MTVMASTARQSGATQPDDAGRLGFGTRFTDHMVTIRWTSAGGWQDPELIDYQHLALDPAAVGLHYGQIVFEGLKAYRQQDGGVALFRPEHNARRINRSSQRLVIPELPERAFLAALHALVAADHAQVPSARGQSLYLRPFIIAVEPTLGVRPAQEYLFVLIASPVGSFFSGGLSPVSVWVSDTFVRAAPGGTGAVKYPGNYAAGFLAQREAAEQGCEQVVWLDAVERRWIEEMGAMNLFFVADGEDGGPTRLLTPRLTGTLLPGVVRDSLLTLAADDGYDVREERLPIEFWQSGWEDGSLREVFASGTAAVVTPVEAMRRGEREWKAPTGTGNPVTLALRERLLDIQYGVTEDVHGWRSPVVLPGV
ncbi:branched-chain amino acid aminotransferase [Streptomyces sp. NBC_01190]|uniref:branched-chain amino acid aminotransferase n=1 Tax=Streptomyces sp. NBC_01190 TaxID=2903767 RepID=UPI00386D66B6|nr:branched-chain amino acid aminotransferase [Streptomyces sp. NBC_01190]